MTRTMYDREHERELAKHEWRPGDSDVLGKYTDPPHRLDTPIPTAVEIAVLVKSADLLAGANLIEQYAKTVASAAAVDAAGHAYRIVDEVLTAGGK